MKKFKGKVVLCFFIVIAITCAGLSAGAQVDSSKAVTIEYASLRTEDADMMNAIHEVFKEKTGITVKFEPIKNVEYDAVLRSSLETNMGPDIMYVRAFDAGRVLYNAGFLTDLKGLIPDVLKKLPESIVTVWTTEDGVVYGLPNAGVTHGVYFNKDIFDKYGLKEPTTWNEFIEVAEILKKNGEVVFAQGIKDAWTLESTMFSNLGPNFFGGYESEQKLLNGEMLFTDKPFVDAFAAMKQLQPFFPSGHQGIGYVDMQQMFANGQTAMFMGGSWELGVFIRMELDFTLGWFPPPVKNTGDTIQYCFHPDNSIGVNIDSAKTDAVAEYLKWVGSAEYAELLMNKLPGWYSFVPGDFIIQNPVAKKMIDVAQAANNMGRIGWRKLASKEPTGIFVIRDALYKLFAGEFTPTQSAEFVHKSLAGWYTPFQKK